jgi:hypothetical protein
MSFSGKAPGRVTNARGILRQISVLRFGVGYAPEFFDFKL